MSRLDDHVAAVQNRLALRKFISALAWLSLFYVIVIWLAVMADRILLWHLPHPMRWFYGGLGTIVAAALAYAIYRRPTVREAAVPIDQKLGLKEKISTALFIRDETDPFARAAVKDAEQTAQQVVLKLNEHFPLSFPRPVIATCAVVILVWASTKINSDRFFGREEAKKAAQAEQVKIEAAKQSVQRALATVQAMPASVADVEAIKLAKEELTAMLEKPITDPAKADRTATRALQDVQDALKQQVKSSAKYANAQNEMKLFRSMQKPVEGQGPVADAHRAIAEGKFTEALNELEKAVENFDKLDKAEQQKAAEQMKNLAQQLQQMAQNNPQQEQKQQQQLQQAGMNQQQAQQAQQLMKQAAQGNQQAAQQLQQMAQQAMQQAGMNQQQQQAAQQMMQQMQAQMNAQNQAQQMQQAAQQMAQAMQQAQQGQQGQQGQPNQGQQAGGQQQGQQGQGQGQGMQAAMQQMQQQLQQMQAAQQDQQQIQAAQQAVQQAQANAGQGGNAGQNPNGQGQPGQWNNGQFQQGQQQNNPNPQQNNGMGGGGAQAFGDRTAKAASPYGVKQEIDPSQDDEKGRILASTLIKDNNPLKGSAKETLKEIANKAANEQTDEVDQERIGRSAQKAVQEYFNTMSKDAQQ